MASETQRQTLAVSAEIWALSSEVRLGQLLAHLGFLGESHLGRGLCEIEDDELPVVLRRHREELRARLDNATIRAIGGVTATNSGGSVELPSTAQK